jgi:hypothetical protein
MANEDFVTTIHDSIAQFKRDLRRFWWGPFAILLVDFLYELEKHRLFEATNRFLDTHISFTWLKPTLFRLQFSLFFRPLAFILGAFLAFISILLLHAYWKTRQTRREVVSGGEPLFSLEAPEEIHSHSPLSLFIRNCSVSRFARNIRFDPIESRFGLKLWLMGLPNLAPQERQQLGFKAGEKGEYRGVVGHVVNFFEGGSSATDQPPYTITIRFLDGRTERTEQQIVEGHPLPNGGVRVEIYPVLDEKQKRKIAREEIGKLAQQLAQCEHDAYDGSNAPEYDSLLGQIQQVKQAIHCIATRYLDSSFESRFLAVNVHDVQLDEAMKMHFISRAQGSFWTVYQQIKGWRACLAQILRELSRD